MNTDIPDYSGSRPPLTFAESLTQHLGGAEDLSEAGRPQSSGLKLNNVLGQILLAAA